MSKTEVIVSRDMKERKNESQKGRDKDKNAFYLRAKLQCGIVFL